MSDPNETRHITTITSLSCPRKTVAGKQSNKKLHSYTIVTPCYALCCGPRRNREPKWIAAVVTKVLRSKSVNVKIMPRGPTCKRHIDQLCLSLRHTNADVAAPPEEICISNDPFTTGEENPQQDPTPTASSRRRRNSQLPDGDQYHRDHLRRSARLRNQCKC